MLDELYDADGAPAAPLAIWRAFVARAPEQLGAVERDRIEAALAHAVRSIEAMDDSPDSFDRACAAVAALGDAVAHLRHALRQPTAGPR